MKKRFINWFHYYDRIIFVSVVMIVVVGILLSCAASPCVARRLNIDPFFFVKRHIIMSVVTTILMLWVSFLPKNGIKFFSLFGYAVCCALLVWTLMKGVEIKGAKRWVTLCGNSLQASEMMKPFLCVLCAWALSSFEHNKGFYIGIAVMVVPICFIILQPDFGMSFLMITTFCAQVFISGIPLIWMISLCIIMIAGGMICYYALPHVKNRIDQFLNPSSESTIDLYQIEKSLQAFQSGGFLGKGPGEGQLKDHVPDVHADFIFSVAGEEFGFIGCVLIIGLFVFLMYRIFKNSYQQLDKFSMLASFGIGMSLFIQFFVNIASSLHLIPTKGMTLPFLSYGGSSMISLSFGIGAVLALSPQIFGRYR